MKNFKNLKTIEDINSIYEFGLKLGEGSYGQVVRATRKSTGSEFAMKIVCKKQIKEQPILANLMI